MTLVEVVVQVVVAVIMKTVTSTHMFLYMVLVNIFLEDIVIHWKKQVCCLIFMIRSRVLILATCMGEFNTFY